MDTKNDVGFVLISLLLAIVIIAILFAMYYGGENSQKSVRRTGQDAIENLKTSNQTEIENNIQIQNELNSIDK